MPKRLPKTYNYNSQQVYYGILLFGIGTIFYCYEYVLRIVPGILQNELSALFGNISASTIGGMSAFYYFAYSPMQVPVGILMDRFGPRLLLSLACFCCMAGSIIYMDFDSIAIASMGRFIVGFGSAFAFVGALTLAVHWLPARYFSLAAGLVTTMGMLGVIFGEIEITRFSQRFGVLQVLEFLIWIGAILSLLIFAVVRNSKVALSVRTESWESFFRNVWRVLTMPQVWVIGVTGAFLFMSLSVFGELWGKTYLERAHHLTKIEAAQTISLLFAGWAIGAPIAGYFSDLSGRRIFPLVAGAGSALIFISIILYVHDLPYYLLNILMLLYGIASSTEIIVFIMGRESCCGERLSGTVFAVINMIIMLGGVIFQPLIGKLLDVFDGYPMIHSEHGYSIMAYQLALSILPLSLITVMILCFFMKDNRRYL